MKTGEIKATFTGDTDAITSVAFSSDGKYVLTASADSTARVWDLEHPAQALRIFFNHRASPVWAVAFSPDGTEVLTGDRNDTARLWNFDKTASNCVTASVLHAK